MHDMKVDEEEEAALSGIQYPGVHDVLSGRGGHTAHPGNLKLRTLIEACKPRYNQVNKLGKNQLASDIVIMWRSQTPMGRFLTKTEPLKSDSLWHDIGDIKAMKKVAQGLRERRSYPMIQSVPPPVDKTPLLQQQQQQQLPCLMEELQRAPLPAIFQNHQPPHDIAPPSHEPPTNTPAVPQPHVDAIITSAHKQQQMEKINEVEQEIKRLKHQNYSLKQIEHELRRRQQEQKKRAETAAAAVAAVAAAEVPWRNSAQQQGPQQTQRVPEQQQYDTPQPMETTPTSGTPAAQGQGEDVRMQPPEHMSAKTSSMGPPPPPPPPALTSDESMGLSTIFSGSTQRDSNHSSSSSFAATKHKLKTSESSSARRLMNESVGSFSDRSSSAFSMEREGSSRQLSQAAAAKKHQQQLFG